jgi:hypothetical protein
VIFKFIIRDRNPAHTRVHVFAGRQLGALGSCGELMLRNEECAALQEVTLTTRHTVYWEDRTSKEPTYHQVACP